MFQLQRLVVFFCVILAAQNPSTYRDPRYPEGHPPDTRTGRVPNPPRHDEPPESPANDNKDSGSSWIAPLIIGAIAAGTVTALIETSGHSAAYLDQHGPQKTDNFSMSDVRISAFVRGNWPFVIDYQLPTGSALRVTVSDGKITKQYGFKPTGASRRQVLLKLPDDFSGDLRPGVYAIQAVKEGTNTPAPVRLFGLAAGDRAVGSVAVDEVQFGPSQIKRKDNAQYGFHTHTDFDQVRAEFMRIALTNYQISVNLDDRQDLKAIPAGEVRNRTWNSAKAKLGDHSLQVRAWRGLSSGGDWVIAWSPDLVEVQ